MKNVIGVCVVVLGFTGLYGCISTKQGYVSKGNKLYDAGKYQDAVLNYRKAIQRDSRFGEAYYRLGLAEIKLNHALFAYDALMRSVELLPNNVKAKEKFADVGVTIYLADRHHPKALYDQLQRLSDELLAANANSYEGLAVKGYLATTDRKSKDAIRYFRQALQVNSSDPGVTTSFAGVLMQDGQAQEAEKLLLDLVTRQKTSYGEAYDLLYAFYMSAQRQSDAENILKLKVANNPSDAEYIVNLARYYADHQKTPQMQATLQRLLDDPKTFPEGRMTVGDFYMGLRNYPEAIHQYTEAIRSKPAGKERSAYQDKALVALLVLGKRQEALRLADQTVSENPGDDFAIRLRADLWLDSHEPDKLDAALKTFQEQSKRNPTDAKLRWHIARTYERKGDLSSARAQLQEALKLQKDLTDAKLELGRISIMERRPDEALEQANEILAVRSDNRAARLLRTRALIAKGDVKTARSELAKLSKDDSQDNEVKLQMSLLAVLDRKFPDAINQLMALRGSGDAEVFAALASIYMSQRNTDKAIEVLNEGLSKSNDPAMIHTQLATIAIISGRYDMAINEFQKLQEMNPKSVENLRRLADMYELKGSQDEAIKLYRQAYEMEPDNVASALALAGAFALAGRTSEARTQYLGIVKAHPDDPIVLNNAAYLLADSGGDLDQALQFAQSALSKAPGNLAFTDTVGYIYLKKGLKDSAVQTFDNLVKKEPHEALFHYHYGLALYEKGDHAKAKQELQTALADHPTKQDAERIKGLLAKLG